MSIFQGQRPKLLMVGICVVKLAVTIAIYKEKSKQVPFLIVLEHANSTLTDWVFVFAAFAIVQYLGNATSCSRHPTPQMRLVSSRKARAQGVVGAPEAATDPAHPQARIGGKTYSKGGISSRLTAVTGLRTGGASEWVAVPVVASAGDTDNTSWAATLVEGLSLIWSGDGHDGDGEDGNKDGASELHFERFMEDLEEFFRMAAFYTSRTAKDVSDELESSWQSFREVTL
ncbi:hypothetical protein H072_1545 [Dactylellina haptotyla CBS 200.50]|uniref:Uncharacterized protein n=1 Tax=Dactylellina haptotyla (strain CBS 200.50) TaxID=1284197 RepID=S8ANP1_DACHA|nr:hypothetical protein H072_1545 [Dactylellina haptotyla CBS 200.50]